MKDQKRIKKESFLITAFGMDASTNFTENFISANSLIALAGIIIGSILLGIDENGAIKATGYYVASLFLLLIIVLIFTPYI
jgi:hypothetical protein